MNMQLSTDAFVAVEEPARRAPTLNNLESEICDVANYPAVCLDYVSSIIVSLARSGKLAHREADAACRMLHTVSESADLLQAQYYEALEADFAKRATAGH